MSQHSSPSTLNKILSKKAIKVKPKIAFTWFKQPAVINAYEGVKAIRVALSTLSSPKHDIPTARLVLRQIRDALAMTIVDIDKVIEPPEEHND